MKHLKIGLRSCLALLALSTLVLVQGCNDSSSGSSATPPPAPVTFRYEITVLNLSNAQPLSPVAAILHDDTALWEIGESASLGLETLAEGGDNSGLLGLDTVFESASGSGPVAPGASATLNVSIDDVGDANLSVVTMLVNTNDAFTGITAFDLSTLASGDSWEGPALIYDAGTEANSEAAGSIPGPADGGTGFDVLRDDVDFVAMHPGVVSADDGLETSVLSEAHRFQSPVMRVKITRVQ